MPSLADNQVPGFNEIVSTAAQQILKAYPWVAGIIILLFAAYLILGIYMGATAEESTLFFGVIKWKKGTELRARFNEERSRLIEAFNEVVLSNRFFGLILLMIRSSLNRFDRIRCGSGSTNDDALQYLCEWISRSIGFQVPDVNRVTLFVPDGDPATATDLVVRAYSGLSPESSRAIRLSIREAEPSFAALAFLAGRIQLCQDVGTDPRYHELTKPPAHEYKSILAMPVVHGEKVIASFTIDSLAENRFGPDDENLAKLFAGLFALFM